MTPALIVELIGGVLTAFAAIMVAVINNRAKKRDSEAREWEESRTREMREFEEAREKREDERAKIRRRETMLIMEMIDATAQLSVVSANALTQGHNNGNVERAREAFEKATSEYEAFKREVAAGVF